MGYAKSCKDVLALVHRVLDSRGVDKVLTTGWWQSFRLRHPNMTLRIAAPLSQARSRSTDAEVLDCYFELLEQTRVHSELEGKPYQVVACHWTQNLSSSLLHVVQEILLQ